MYSSAFSSSVFEMLTFYVLQSNRRTLAKLFHVSPEDVNIGEVFREMVDAAERYFFAYEKV